MKITDVKSTYISSPLPEEFHPAWAPGAIETQIPISVVEIFTNEGIVGIGACETHGTGEGTKIHQDPTNFSVAYTVDKMIKPYFIGQDPFKVEELARFIRAASSFGSRVWFVEMALWDIIGKASNQPIYRLLGASHDKIKAYASTGEVKSPEQRVEDIQKFYEEGWRAVKLRFHSISPYDDLKTVKMIREALGDKIEIMVDANQADPMCSPSAGPVWDYKIAFTIAKELEQFDVRWLEEPLHGYNYKELSQLTAHTLIDIAGGENKQGIHEFRDLIINRCYNTIQPDCTLSEGLFQIRKIAAIAEAHYIKVIPHTWSNGLGLVGNLHLAASIPNCSYFEYPYDPPAFTFGAFNWILQDPVGIDKDGYIVVPDKPGLGVELNQDVMKRYGSRL